MEYTFTTSSTTNYIVYDVAYGSTYISDLQTYLNTIQLEKGSTATSYAEHKGNTFPTTLPTGMFLGAIGTASNYIYGTRDNWKLHSGLAKTTDTTGSTDITINDMKSGGGFYSYYGGTLSGTTITYASAIGDTNTIYYEKATSTETDITDSTLVAQLNAIADNLETYKGGTIVFTTSANLEPNIQFDYMVNPFASVNSDIADIKNAILSLGGEV